MLDLLGDLLAAIRELLELRCRFELRFRAPATGRRRAIAASRLVSLIELSNSFPVCSVNRSTSDFASPERRRIVRVTARSVRPINLERSRTRRFCSPTNFASFLPSRASARTPCAARSASVGYFTSASITVESIRTALARNRFDLVASTINARVSSFTVSAPIRRVSLRTVDSSGTRSESAIRQNLRRWIESDTSATNDRYPHRYLCLSTINLTYVSIAIVGRPSVNTNRPVSTTSRRQRSNSTIISSGSANTRSNSARSPGNSRTSIGNASSHNDSGCPAQSISTQTPLDDQKPPHLQGILTITPDGTDPSNPSTFSSEGVRLSV